MDVSSDTRKGLFSAAAAYLWWGAIPLYFKAVASVPSLLVLDHRVLWSAAFLIALVSWQRRWPAILQLMRRPGKMGLLLIAAVLVATNWGVFIYAVAVSKVMQTSLGYFINPLLSIVLGLVVLRERLRPAQWVAVLIASVGVAYLTWQTGEFPWIAMTLAGSFGFYGLVRKVANVAPIDGLAIETLVLIIPAAAILPHLSEQSPPQSMGTYLVLSLSGIVTVLPLIWFTQAVQHLRLATVGFFQYIGPTCQFFLALLVFREPLDHDRLIAFVFCWVAVAVYVWSTIRFTRSPKPAAVAVPVELD